MLKNARLLGKSKSSKVGKNKHGVAVLRKGQNANVSPSDFGLKKASTVSDKGVKASSDTNPATVATTAVILIHDGKTKRIYTEWANHYLEKAKCKRQIQDLQVDVTDGVVLAEVIEAVTTQRVPEVHRKPKTSSQMLDNIQSCLVFLSQLGVALEGISARDIRDGHLKSILSLFFQLSRYKQQQKQQDRDRHNNQRQQQSAHLHHQQTIGIPDNSGMMQPHHAQQHYPHHASTGGGGGKGSNSDNNKHGAPAESSKLPSPYCKQHTTSIPLPQQGQQSGVVPGISDNRVGVPLSSSSSGGAIIPHHLQHHNHHSFPQNHHLLQQQQHHHHPHGSGGSKKTTAGASYPSGVDKGKGVGGHPYSSSGSLNGVRSTSGNSSRSTSPSSAALTAAGNLPGGGSGIPHSFIPQPRGSSSIPSAPSSARSSIHEKHLPSGAKLPSSEPVPSSTTINSSSSKSYSTTAASRTQNNNQVNAQQHGSSQQLNVPGQNPGKGGNAGSMLEKFKFFKDKDKGEKVKGGRASTSSCGSNKHRTSSSSGFSSARSERSDSSVSLSSDSKQGVTVVPVSSSGVIFRNRGGDRGDLVPKSGQTQMVVDSSSSTCNPRPAIKGFRQKLGKAVAPGKQESGTTSSSTKHHSHHSSSSSPKSSRKDGSDLHQHHYSNGSGSKTSSTSISSSRSKSRAMTKQTSQEVTESPTSSCGNLAVGDNGSTPTPSFLRQPKSQSGGGGAGSRDSKHRVSGTGIPTRNSLIVGGGSTKDHHPHQEVSSTSSGGTNTNPVNINLGANLNLNSVSTTSLNSTSSSNTNLSSNQVVNPTNGLLQNLGNGTGIPKPTAAVKGTTKQPSKQQPSVNENGTKQGNNYNNVRENGVDVEASEPSKPEVTSCSSSDSRSNISQNSFSSEKSSTQINKTSTSSSIKSIDANGGITVALVSPMPSLTKSGSNTASMSSLESGSQSALTQSQFSTSSVSQSNSNSNSSDVTVMLASKYQQQQSSTDNILTSLEEESPDEKIGGAPNSTKLEIGSPPSTNKISPASDFASSTPSGSSSMGSLNKVGVELGSSSSGTSLTSPTAPEDNANQKKDSKQIRHVEKVKEAAENNGNSVISECEEEDLLINVTPMEPLLRNSPYGYIKSPPGSTTSSTAFFQAQQKTPPNCIQMRRPGSGENGNQPSSNRALVTSTGNRQCYPTATSSNTYCDPNRVVTRRAVPPPLGSFSTSGYASSATGDYDYVDIDNFDMNAAGYLSDGDLLTGNGADSHHRLNDGYVSESGVSIYGRRVPHQNNSHPNRREVMTNSPGNSSTTKHGVITEDSFDDSSSISSEISDPNEIGTDLTSSSVNSEVSSPYDSLQRGVGIPEENNGKVLNSLHKQTSKKLEGVVVPPFQSSNIIYRVVGSRSSSRRSTAADTSDLNTNSGANTNNPGFSPHYQNRSATLPVGFVDPSRALSGKGVHKQGHLVSNLRGSESSSSLRTVASQGSSTRSATAQQPPISSTTVGVVLTGGGDYATRVVTRDSQQQPHHHRQHLQQPPPHNGTNGVSHGGGAQSETHKRSMNNLDPKSGSGGGGRRGMMGIKEDHYGGCSGGKDTTQRGSPGSSGSSSSSAGGICEGGGGKRSGKIIRMSSPSPVGNSNGGNGFGFMRRPGAGGSKYAVPVTSTNNVGGGGKVTMIGVRGEQNMMTVEEFKQAHAALAVASSSPSHISPYSVITTIQQQHQYHQHQGGTQSPKVRTKVKVSGGTQTTNDLHEMGGRGGGQQVHYSQQQQQNPMLHHGHHHHSQTLPGHAHQQHSSEQDHYASSTCSRNSGSFAPSTSSQGMGGSSSGYKSLSLTTPTAAQLSQSLRERILGSQSLPKGANSSADYAAILAAMQHQNHHQQIYGTPNASRERMSRYAAAAALSATGNGNGKNMDGGYATYNEIYASAGAGSGNTPYSWLRHSTGYASSITSAPTRLIGAGGSMTEAESMESLSSTSSLAVQLRDGRSNSLTQGRMQSAQQSREREQGSPSRSPRLNRSNSIRSTKSEKLYPSMLQRGEDGNPYYSSTMSASGVPALPTSPIHGPAARICSGSTTTGPGGPYSSAASASSNHSVRMSMSPYSGFLAKLSAKEDDINASSLSLVSTASSLYSSQEDKHAHEVRKLRRELSEAQEKVQTLTNQLTTNAHVVAAFEQSLSNMTQRLQTLTLTAEQKDSELTELRQTIDMLRKQSVEAGLTVAQITAACEESPMARQLSADSVSSINSISSACSGASHSHASSPSGQVQLTPSGTPTHSAGFSTPESPGSKKKNSKGKGWLRSSFTKAFSRSKAKSRNDSSPEHGDGMILEHEGHHPRHLSHGELGGTFPQQYGNPPNMGPASHLNHPHRMHRTIPNPHQQSSPHHHLHSQGQGQNGVSRSHMMATSPLLSPPNGDGRKNNSSCSVSTGSHSPRSNGGNSTVTHDGRSRQGSSSGLSEEPVEEPRSMDELKKQLREKEMVLTDIRLEALTSAHQLESLKETVTKMRNEMLSLKQDNERLQRMVTCKSLTSSQSSLQLSGGTDGVDRRLSASEVPPPSSTTLEMFLTGDATEKEGKRIVVSVYLGCHGSYERYISPVEGLPAQECVIGTIAVSNRTKWDALDTLVKRAFKDYLMRIDPKSSLGLSADSVLSYSVGEVLRTKDASPPELLPCGYLVGDVTKVRVCLRGAILCELDALAFETLVPKSVLQRFMSLLSDNGRIIICGPSGTGKSYLARKLGEYLVARWGKDPCPEAIASFSADHKNSKELRQYLSNLVEQCDVTSGIDLPHVIILDNLHQVQNLGEVFNGVLLKQKDQSPSTENLSSPIIIGTMTQSASSPPTSIHHNFRWMVFANHTEPVKGLLGRFLQRRLIEVDTQNGTKNLDLSRVVDWIPKVWHHINKFLEAHNSNDVTIGPRLFLSCPMDVINSQAWFADLWHYSVIPYLIEAVKEGLQLYGKKVAWEDPAEYLCLTYPWAAQQAVQFGKSSYLQRIRAEDVGYDTKSGGHAVGNGSSKGSSNGGDNGGDQDPLMNMLLRLQEAANYSGPQSNDSDSTSMDSHVSSLDPKDFVATA